VLKKIIRPIYKMEDGTVIRCAIAGMIVALILFSVSQIFKY